MIDKNKVIEVLKKHPKGLKAREIAELIPETDKKEVNSILYSNPQLFEAKDYVWTLRTMDRSSKHNASLTSSIEVDEYFKLVKFYFGEYSYWSISYRIKDKLKGLGANRINECSLNLKTLINAPIIRECYKYFTVHTVEYIINLTMLPHREVQKRISKAGKFDISTFDAWRTIAELPDYKYENLLSYRDRLEEIEIPLCYTCRFPTWNLLSHLLEKNDFEMIKMHSTTLCNTINFENGTIFTSEEWLAIVTLTHDKFLLSLDNIKSFVENDEKYHFIKFHISIKDVIPFSYLPSRKFHESVNEAYKKKLVEDLQNKKHPSPVPTKQNSSMSPVLEVARKCTGNCSTCNRENCPER